MLYRVVQYFFTVRASVWLIVERLVVVCLIGKQRRVVRVVWKGAFG